jgi:hypothetical protein
MTKRVFGAYFALATTMSLLGCGGQQEPAAAPEEPIPAASESKPVETIGSPAGAAEEPSGEGEHTMPDGTKMPGDQHHDH